MQSVIPQRTDIVFRSKLPKKLTFLIRLSRWGLLTQILRDTPYFPTGQVRDPRRITRYTLRIAGPFAKRVSEQEREREREGEEEKEEEREKERKQRERETEKDGERGW